MKPQLRYRDEAGKDAPREIELKLEVDPGAIGRVLAHPLIASAPAVRSKSGELHAIYFDTPSEQLQRAGLSLRIRREGRRWIQTVKAMKGAKGLVADRLEWEIPVKGAVLNLTAARTTALGPLLANGLLKDLRPAFSVRSNRSAFLIERDGAAIELSVDRAEVVAGRRTKSFGEIELELKVGEPTVLFAVALDLFEAAPMRLSLTAKSERGYSLAGQRRAKAVKAKRIALTRGTTSGEAFQIIARSCLAQVIQNEAILRETRDPSALHQMRVGLRRLRAAMSLFGKLLRDGESRAIRNELRQIGHGLSEARSLDAFIAMHRKAGRHDAAIAKAEDQRRQTYDAVLDMLNGSVFRHAVLASAAWIEAGRWRDEADLHRARHRPIEKRAVSQLTKRWKRVLKRAKHLAQLDPDERHGVRIAIKKLRYGVEFFGNLFAGAKARAHRKAAVQVLEDLQDVLGELNDIAIMGDLSAIPPDKASVAKQRDRSTELLSQTEKDYRDLAKITPFWRSDGAS